MRPDYAFSKQYDFMVDSRKYHAHSAHDFDFSQSNGTASPVVSLAIRRRSGEQRNTQMLVDTGACLSLLSYSASRRLGFHHWFGRRRVLRGITGRPFVVLVRKAEVLLGNTMHTIPVGISPSPFLVRSRSGDALAGTMTTSVLGREGVLNEYLLCMDRRRLYAFKRKVASD